MEGREASWMAGCLVAKAKVAGSNPVFRSKYARILYSYRGSAVFIFIAAQGDGRRFTTVPAPPS